MTKVFTEEHRKHLSEALKGNTNFKDCIPWNKGLTGIKTNDKGHVAWNKGKHTGIKPWLGKTRSLETRQKMSENRKGIGHTIEARKKISQGLMGRPVSQETREKMSKSNSGTRNHFWRGGITPFKLHLRMTRRYRNWRNSVFERDNWTCQDCGKKGYVEADHIKPLVKILREYNIKTFEAAFNCQELWDINNGRTLCENCHKATETYGIKGVMLCQILV